MVGWFTHKKCYPVYLYELEIKHNIVNEFLLHMLNQFFCFSTPILYAKCLHDLGLEVVHKYQGREPSGRIFNEIALDHRSN